MLEDTGHLAEVVGEEIDYNSRQERIEEEHQGETEETSHMQAGRPTKFAARAAGDGVPETMALPENNSPGQELEAGPCVPSNPMTTSLDSRLFLFARYVCRSW